MLDAPRLGLVTLYTDDLEAARRFYRDFLGLRAVREEADFSALRAGDVTLVVHATGRKGESNVPTATLLILDVESFEGWRERAAEHSLEAKFREVRGRRQLGLRDPDGNTVYLEERRSR